MSDLPAVNASLNALATVLLLVGYVLIKQRREAAHKRTMLTAFAVSIVFLVCYLVYHRYAGHVKFGGPSPVREFYYTLLLSHVVLAATVPFFAVATIYLGLKDRRAAHRRLGALDVSDLALRIRNRRGDLRHALSPLPAGWRATYNKRDRRNGAEPNDEALRMTRLQLGLRSTLQTARLLAPILLAVLCLSMASLAEACPLCKQALENSETAGADPRARILLEHPLHDVDAVLVAGELLRLHVPDCAEGTARAGSESPPSGAFCRRRSRPSVNWSKFDAIRLNVQQRVPCPRLSWAWHPTFELPLLLSVRPHLLR